MTSLTPPPESQPPAGQPVQPSSADPATAGAAKVASGSVKGYDTATEVSNMGDLKDKAPEVYDEMIKGIGLTIVRSMRRHQDQLKKMMREGRQQN